MRWAPSGATPAAARVAPVARAVRVVRVARPARVARPLRVARPVRAVAPELRRARVPRIAPTLWCVRPIPASADRCLRTSAVCRRMKAAVPWKDHRAAERSAAHRGSRVCRFSARFRSPAITRPAPALCACAAATPAHPPARAGKAVLPAAVVASVRLCCCRKAPLASPGWSRRRRRARVRVRGSSPVPSSTRIPAGTASVTAGRSRPMPERGLRTRIAARPRASIARRGRCAWRPMPDPKPRKQGSSSACKARWSTAAPPAAPRRIAARRLAVRPAAAWSRDSVLWEKARGRQPRVSRSITLTSSP